MSEATIRIYGVLGSGEKQISAESVARELEAIGTVDVLNVRIVSPGGSIHEAMAVYTLLTEYSGKVVTICDSIALSAAALIFLAGEERRMSPGSHLMYHAPRMELSGEAEDLETWAATLRSWRATFVEILQSRAGLSQEVAESILQHGKNIWIKAVEAVQRGFATSIQANPAVSMKFDLSGFGDVPEAVADLVSGSPEMHSSLVPPVETPMADEVKNTIDSEKLAKFAKEFGPQNAIEWIGLDYSEALAKHNAILVQQAEQLRTERDAAVKAQEDLQAHLDAIPKGEESPVNICNGEGAKDGDKDTPKCLADLVKIS